MQIGDSKELPIYTNMYYQHTGKPTGEFLDSEIVPLNTSFFNFDIVNKGFDGKPVVKVNAEGKLEAVGYGTATLTASLPNYTDQKGFLTKTISVPVPVTSISITPASAELMVGESVQLAVEILPENASDKTFSLELGGDVFISLTENGLVTAKRAGETTISAFANNSGISYKKATFNVKIFNDFRKAVITDLQDKTHTGSPITQKITVKNGNYVLEENKDYKIEYTDNTNVGTAKVKLTGIGEYKGEQEKTFQILDVGSETLTIENTTFSYDTITYTGLPLAENVTVKNAKQEILEKDKDYTVSYQENTNVGTATTTITGKGNYDGTFTHTFRILPVALDSKTAKVDGVQNKNYTGYPITLPLSVKIGSKTLLKDTDYTITYMDNTNAGTATITIAGSGNYTGTLTNTFRILTAALDSKTAKVDGVQDKNYTGYPITLPMSVKIGSKTLTKDTDYTITYIGNTNAGTATIIIAGCGNYNGTLDYTFCILPIALDSQTAKVDGVQDKTYTGYPITQSLSVKIGGKTLIKDIDYTITYMSNTHTGTSTIIIAGCGNYTGTLVKTFLISSPPEPVKPAGHWVMDGTGWWYSYSNGSYPRGTWDQIDGTWYYFNGSGYIVTGWNLIGSSWYYFQGSGAMATGWINPGGNWYYLNCSGAMLTGWYQAGNSWYYSNGSGIMQTGWLNLGGTWYYLSGSGSMLTGWANLGSWYYFTGSGAMATGWINLDDSWYYLNGGGSMATGWLNLGGTWYYLSKSGAMLTGWANLGSWYYLTGSGAMATNTWIGSCFVDGSGRWV